MDLKTPVTDLGPVGIWSASVARAPVADALAIAREAERLGFGALWFPEMLAGREALSTAAVLLGGTERMVIATGVASIWARDAAAAAAGSITLTDAHPGRFVLGIGVSHAPTVGARGHDYRRPVAAMDTYLDALESCPYAGSDPGVPVVMAALGPKMLRLAAERASGVHPYLVPVDHTISARAALGAGTFLAPEQAVVLESDPDLARSVARGHLRHYLALDNYRRSLLRLGWDAADLGEAGSDPLVDAVVAWGGEEAIVERIAGHLAAGADHVSIQVLTRPDEPSPIAAMRRLARALRAASLLGDGA